MSKLTYSIALLALGFMTGSVFSGAGSGPAFLSAAAAAKAEAAPAQAKNRVFELRTYTAPPGKLNDLHARFRDHTRRIFEKHGMTNIGYWTPQDAPRNENTLVYIISHESRDQAKANWAAFGADPEWKKVSAESQVNGRIVEKVESVFLDPTDYSAIK